MSLSGSSSSPGSRRSHVDMAATDFNITRIKEIQSKFAKGENLFIPGRCFIREGILTKICRKGPKKRHFFLFDDILVYGTPFKGNLLSNQTILQLSEMGVSANCHYAPSVDMEFESPGEGLSKDLAFQVNHTDKSFHVFATSENDRENWIRNLTTYISRSRNDEDGENPTFSPVWLPDITCNNCMLCNTEFTIIRRKHHCRECGRLVCSTCSSHEINLMSLRTGGHSKDSKEERVCDRCFVLLQSAQRKEKGNSGGKKVVDMERPPRPSRPPAVVGSRKEPPPKPIPYAAARKSIKVSETVKTRNHEISDESEDSGDSEVEDSDPTRQHKENRTSSQQPTTGSTAVPPQTSDLAEPPSKVEPYPAPINPGGENKTESKDAIRQTGEPGSKSVEEKKAIFVDKLIQIKPPPVPAPRKGKEDDQEGATVKEPILSGQEKDSEVSATPPETSQESSTPVGVSEGGAVRPPPRRKRQSKFVKQTPKESANSRENGAEGMADKNGGQETPKDIVQVEGTTLPTPTPVYKTSGPVEETSEQVDDTSRQVDVKEEILGTDDANQKNSTLDCEDSTVLSEQSKEDQQNKEDKESKEDSEREENAVNLSQLSTTEDSTPSDHVVQEAGTNDPNSLEKDQPSLVDDQVDSPVPSVPAEDHTTSVPDGDRTTSVPAGDRTTSVPAGDHTTSVPAGDHTAPEKGVLSEDSTRDQVPSPTIVVMEEKDGTSTTQSDKVQEDQKHLILQVDKNSPEASPNTARKKARGRKNKFT